MIWNRLRSFLPAFLLLGGFGGCGALVLSPIFEHAKMNAQRASCQSNLKSIAMACELYMADNGDQFPPLSSNGKGWAEILNKYPMYGAELVCPTGERSTFLSSDYFYNARLAKLKSESVINPSYKVLFGEGMDNGPTNSHLNEFPTPFEPEAATFSTRHSDGTNLVFADRHVQWYRLSRAAKYCSFEPSFKVNHQ